MSKRLNKRQQREQEELEQLQAQQKETATTGSWIGQNPDDSSDEEEVVAPGGGGGGGAFALLQGDAPEDSEDSEEEVPEAAAAVAAPKKSKKKKNKKKKKAATATAAEDSSDEDVASNTKASKSATPGTKGGKGKKGGQAESEGMDEVDRALAELKLKYGEEDAAKAGAAGTSSTAAGSSLAYRQLLSVDPKNLDADAELRRFFGSKVITSGNASSKSHRPGPSSKLRYTISKPKPTYPPTTSLGGLGMREMTDEEVEDLYDRREWDDVNLGGEKWYTFEHSGAYREIERQFLGAVRSHDPNQLMALLQVYPWHVDTLLQMSEVYRLQSDIGAASEYAERALYALDRCLLPAFNVSSGGCRVDFDRVENRPLFTALHRNISYLGRRGCWNTAFNFAKLLLALDPYGDPHGALLWVDFLAVKSGNSAWLLSMLDEKSWPANAEIVVGYPGLAYARALALRATEDAEKSKDHSKSDAALRRAFMTFPQVIVPLADKIGANLPAKARTHKLTAVQAGFVEPDNLGNLLHLLAHIYMSRSEPLWKEAASQSWFEKILPGAIDALDSVEAKLMRENAYARWTRNPRDPIDTHSSIPLSICRHIVTSESTAFQGFLPPSLRSSDVQAFDPLPPSSAITAYDRAYFGGGEAGPGVGGGGARGRYEAAAAAENNLMQGITDAIAQNPDNWREAVRGVWGELMQGNMFRALPAGQQDNLLNVLLAQLAGEAPPGEPGEEIPQAGDGRMPGGFPGEGVVDEDSV